MISYFLGTLISIGAFLVVLTILVFVHELGHYLSARRNGVRIEVFSIGFGKEIFGFTDKAGTRWKFSAIPLGGYVKMFGDANVASQPGDEIVEMTDDEKNAIHRENLRILMLHDPDSIERHRHDNPSLLQVVRATCPGGLGIDAHVHHRHPVGGQCPEATARFC